LPGCQSRAKTKDVGYGQIFLRMEEWRFYADKKSKAKRFTLYFIKI